MRLQTMAQVLHTFPADAEVGQYADKSKDPRCEQHVGGDAGGRGPGTGLGQWQHGPTG